MSYITVAQTLSSAQLWERSGEIFWTGGLATIRRLTFEEFDKCIEWYNEATNDEITDLTNLNDFFWFEDDTIHEIVGRDI